MGTQGYSRTHKLKEGRKEREHRGGAPRRSRNVAQCVHGFGLAQIRELDQTK